MKSNLKYAEYFKLNKLLKIKNLILKFLFKKTISQFINSNNNFYLCIYFLQNIVGIIRIISNQSINHIKIIVFYPKYFR